MNRIGKITSVLLGAAAFVAVTAVTAQAAPMRAWICDSAACGGVAGVNFVVVTDNMAGDTSGAAGNIVMFGPNGVGITISTSYPTTGSPAVPFLNLTYLAAAGAVPAGGAWVYATQDQFTYAGQHNFIANATAGSGFATAFRGTGVWPGPPGAAGQIPAGCGSLPYNDTGLDGVCSFGAPTAPYFLAIGLNIFPNNLGAASGDATIQAVPEPASMALFGLGLLGAGLAARRRRQQQ